MKASDLDELLCSTARMAIMSALIAGEPKSFMELRSETGLKDGNLHVQTRKLEAAEYISIQQHRRRTIFHMTDLGILKINRHLWQLHNMKQLGPAGFEAAPRKRAADDSQVW